MRDQCPYCKWPEGFHGPHCLEFVPTVEPAPVFAPLRLVSSQHLPDDAKERKAIPLATGVLDYFPDALLEIARLSKIGNDQHNPGEPLRWSREKSNDHPDCLLRHFIDRGKVDTDKVRHSAKMAWRALAILQLEIEAAASQIRTAETPCA